MFDPIGPLLTNFDALILGSQNIMVTTVQENMADPAWAAALLFLTWQGVEWAQGNREVPEKLILNLFWLLTILWLVSDFAAYDTWIHQLFYVGLPNKLVAVAASAGGSMAVADLSSVTSAAAVFSQLWNQTWVAITMAWAHAGIQELVAVFLTGAITALMAGLGLLVLGLVYLCSHILLAVMDDITPFLLVFAMFKTTRPIFERGIGKAFALILMQFVGVVVLQVVLAADQAFMQQIIAAASHQPTTITGALAALNSFLALPFGPGAAPADNTMAADMQALISIVVMFVAGAFAMLSISAIAYSIGTGISVSATSMLMGGMVAANGTAALAESIKGLAASLPQLSQAPNYGAQVTPRAAASLPSSPPPPALSHSTRPNEFRAA